ncbi:MAG: molecular chaperone HtpG, partial [Clostridia bacterium]|nr:molecular chaperone HtpG [Clostridia bacterium]
DTYIDPHFVSFIEYKNPKVCRFVRIDADLDGALKGENGDEETQKKIVEIFKEHLVNKEIQVKAEAFKSNKVPAIVTVEEFIRRMSEMNGFYGMDATDPTKNATLVLNLSNPVVAGIAELAEEKRAFVINQIYYLAMLSYKKLSPEELSDFVEKSAELLKDYTK